MQAITLSTEKICDDLRDLVSFLHSKKCDKHPQKSVTFRKLKTSVCNFTESNTPPWMFFTFFKLCKQY